MVDANVNVFMHHLIHWSSTLAEVTGVKLSAVGNNYPIVTLGSSGANLYTQVDKIARAIRHRFTSNSRGMVQVVPDPLRQNLVNRDNTIICDIDASDWTRIQYVRDYYPRIHWLQASAIVAGTSTKIAVVFSRAPGDTPGQGVSSQTLSQLLVLSQSELNAVTGHDYARLNATENVFDLDLAHRGDIGIEPANMQFIRASIPENITAPDGLNFIDARFLPLSVMFTTDSVTGTQRCRIRVEKETEGVPGVTYIPPTYQFPDLPNLDFELPDFSFPIPESDLGDYRLDEGQGVYAVITNQGEVYATENLSAPSPNWALLDLRHYGFDDLALHAKANPFSDSYMDVGSEIDVIIAGLTSVWRIRDIFGPNMQVQRVHNFLNIMSERQVEFSRGIKNWSIIMSRENSGSLPVSATWTRDLLSWEEVQVTSEALTGNTVANEEFYPGLWMSPFQPGVAITTAWFNSAADASSIAAAYMTQNFGQNWNIMTNPAIDPNNFLAETLTIPYALSLTKNTAFFMRSTFNNNPNNYDGRLYRAIGTQVKDISPFVSTHPMAPIHSPRSFDLPDSNPQRMYLIGANSDEDSSPDRGIFRSDNVLDSVPTWSTILSPGSESWWMIFASAANPDVFFVVSQSGKIAMSLDAGATGLVDKTGDMTHSNRIVGIVSGQGINPDGTGGFNPPTKLPGPDLPASAKIAVILDDAGNLGYSEDFRTFNPTMIEVNVSVLGTIKDISWDENCEYLANNDGTGQVDIYVVTRDISSVLRIYHIQDVTGTPSETLLDAVIDLDHDSAIDPVIENSPLNPSYIGVAYSDKDFLAIRFSDNLGSSWSTAGGSFTNDANISNYQIALAMFSNDVIGTRPLEHISSNFPYYTVQSLNPSMPRPEHYSDGPFTAVRLSSNHSVAFVAKPAKTDFSVSALFDFDNPNRLYGIVRGSLGTGLSGQGLESELVIGQGQLIDVRCYLDTPKRLSKISFSYKFTHSGGTANSIDHVTIVVQTFNRIDTLMTTNSEDIYFNTISPDVWYTHTVQGFGQSLIATVRVNLDVDAFGSRDYFPVIDNIFVTFDQNDPIDSETSAQLIRIEPFLSSSADWFDVTPGGSGGFVPQKTWGLAVSQDGDPSSVAIVGRNLSGTLALCRSIDSGQNWLITLLPSDVDMITYKQSLIVLWGPDGIVASSNNGGTFFDKKGTWYSDIEDNVGFKKVLVSLNG